MVKGFLLVDQYMNTVIIPVGDEDLKEWMKSKINMGEVHEHRVLKELDADIRAYLKNTYEQEGK